MSSHSAFEKKYVDPKDQSNVEGLLEHFNLPPKAIAFLRKNKKRVQITLAVVVTVVVAGSLYDSYKEKQLEKAASSLTLALKETGAEQKSALQRVVDQYGSTPSGTWAKIELAHYAVKEKDYARASTLYSEVNKETGHDNPLFALSLVGVAQVEEAMGNSDNAINAYEQLQKIKGYELTGYGGVARIYESSGDFEKALGIYGQYLTVLGDDPEAAAAKALIEGKIARLKARQ